MPGSVKRPYHSPLREESARRTRAAIREAGTALFTDQGYTATTVKQIAAAAGVAPRTVFAAYPGGKQEIFTDALNVAVAGDERPLAVADRSDFQEMLADPDGVLDRLVDLTSDLLERAGLLIMATVGSAGADPDMRRLAEEGARATTANLRRVAEALAAHGRLRPGLTVPDATDTLFALASPHVHALLRRDRGWSAAQYRQWLRQLLAAVLSGAGPASQPPSR